MFTKFIIKVNPKASQKHWGIHYSNWVVETIFFRWAKRFQKGKLERSLEMVEKRGKWQETSNPLWWEYHETEEERAWANNRDRKYLRILIKKDANEFLEEMTPNPGHDGVCMGLDLTHPHHQNLQKEFQAEVRRLCQEKGLTNHPALLDQKQHQFNSDGGSKPSKENHLQEKQEIADLKKEVVAQSKKIKQLSLTNQQILDEKNILQQEKQTLMAEKDVLQQRTRALEKAHKALQQTVTRYTQANEQLQVKLKAARISRPSWLRIWEGKYQKAGETIAYEAVAAKEKGCAIGFIAKNRKGQHFMAKLGLPNEEHQVSETLSTHKRNFQRSVISVITEKLAADIYAVLGHGFYYVPKHRLARLDILNRFTKKNALAIAVMQTLNHGRDEKNQIKEGIHLLSRWIEQYRDIDTLSQCLLHESDEKALPFMDCLSMGYVPQFAIVEGRSIPILGLMEILAASRLLSDTDVLGGGGKNAGYVIEKDAQGLPLAVRMVKIDAGEAFNFSGENNQLMQSFNAFSRAMKLKDPKDIQFGNQQPINIQYAKLTPKQKNAFLQALTRGLDFLSQKNVVDFLIHRRGEFDRAAEGPRILLIDTLVNTFKEAWHTYRNAQTMPQTYGDEIKQAEALAPSKVPFRPKMYGAVNHCAQKAVQLSVGGSGK